jgi:hypothetical protein
MKLEQATSKIYHLAILPDDLPTPSQWDELECAIATVRQAIVSNEYLNGRYSKKALIELLSSASVVLGLAKAGGYHAIDLVLADENTNVTNWLDSIVA